jgi:hypothetical protein
MWVRFTSEHWHRFTPQMKRRYPKDTVANVRKAVAEKAIAQGHAVAMRKRSRHAKPEPIDGETS